MMLLQDYLSESASMFADKIAVNMLNESLTYRELEEQSSQLANLLLQHHIGAGCRVGLYIDKSPNAVMSIFAILKAGAAYVPLDTQSPVERVAYICADCQLSAIVVDDSGLGAMQAAAERFSPSLIMICLTDGSQGIKPSTGPWRCLDKTAISEQPKTIKSKHHGRDQDPAYILYTSGSTGKPKGVMLSHKNATVFVDWTQDIFQTNHQDILSSHAPFHFDLSILDIFLSIKSGATLCLIPAGMAYFADAMLEFVYEKRISVWYSVPNAIMQWLAFKDELAEKLASIRILIYAGEVFPYRFLNQLTPYVSGMQVYNLYGPTETNVITYHRLQFNGSKMFVEDVPIGEPCPYAQIRILDENNQPVKPGEIGELVVRGDSLMDGYWNDQKKTDAAIKDVPMNGRIEKFYFTGDMAYQREDRQIIYVSRRDNMVKTRGFRVELGEIESVLQKHPLIYQTTVVAVPDEQIGNRLIAYYSTLENRTVDTEEIADFCTDRLPSYMLPGQIIHMADLPKNTRGKIDREYLKHLAVED